MTDDTKALVAKLKQLWPSLRLLAAEAQDDYGERFPLALEAKHAATLIAAAVTEIERQGKALRAVEALAAKLRREDRFTYASDIYDALERDD